MVKELEGEKGTSEPLKYRLCTQLQNCFPFHCTEKTRDRTTRGEWLKQSEEVLTQSRIWGLSTYEHMKAEKLKQTANADSPQTQNTDIRADMQASQTRTARHNADPHLFSSQHTTHTGTHGHRDGHILLLKAQLLCTPVLNQSWRQASGEVEKVDLIVLPGKWGHSRLKPQTMYSHLGEVVRSFIAIVQKRHDQLMDIPLRGW